MTFFHQDQAFKKLDSDVQTIIVKLAESPQSFDRLKSQIQVESRSIKGHITNKLQQQENDLAHKYYRQEFLKSLWFHEIHRRQETVGEAHQRTFQWIFEPSGLKKSARRWQSFVEWLEHGDGIYWISGKAGSGKSTLMSYICQDDRTAHALRVWSGVKGLLILSFYFWNAGAELEKTSEGMLRSLLYQILYRFPRLNPLSYDSHSMLEYATSGQNEVRPIGAWTEPRLHTMLQNVLRQIHEVCRVCIFIDGLDESSGDQDRLIAVVEGMVSADAKICVSSRPDRSFFDAFDSGNKLRLQDLTEPDILTYLRDQVQQYLQKRPADEHEVSRILDSIADKAQGVFLWVRLVVKTLIDGLRNHDSLDQLRIRVESTPSDIEAMYAKMLSNIDVAHRKEAALLFLMALNSMTGSLLNVTYVLCKEIYHVTIASGQSAVLFSRQILARIPTVGAGLLEVNLEDKDSAKASEKKNGDYLSRTSRVTLPLGYACSSEMTDLSYYERYAHVDFIHRTAIDFLLRSKQGQFFLKEHTAPCFSLSSTYAKGLLAKVSSLGFPEKPNNIDPDFYEAAGLPANFHAEDLFDVYVNCVAGGFVREVMNRVEWVEFREITRGLSEEERMTDSARFSLCDEVDSTFATIYQRYRVDASISHWVTRWHPGNYFGDGRPSFARGSRMTSRSSSSESFDSARSEPTLSPFEPIDFLGLAASWGLSRYVQTKLELQSNHLDKTYTNYLLCCSVPLLYLTSTWSRYGHWVVAILYLIAELMSRGGNPNAYVGVFSTTLWGLFLDYLGIWRQQHSFAVSTATAKATAITAEAFLNAGAEVQMKRSYDVGASHEWDEVRLFGASKSLQVDLCFEASPLYIVQQFLKTAPESKTVEEIMTAKGGSPFHRYTSATVYIGDPRRVFKISEKQHEELMVALNVAHDQCVPQCNTYADWVTLREKICLENLIRFADSDDQASSDDDDELSDADAEDEFHECFDTKTVEDPEDDHLLEQ